MRDNWLPKEERKTILFLSDDMRVPSGIGTMSKEIVEGTCHYYNWVQLGAAINHPDQGKIIDMGPSISQKTGVEDPSVIVYPFNGYGNPFIVRQLIAKHDPDAILHFTDPRYWTWLYEMENEIRQNIPIFFYTIWDDLPYPWYNELFYRSCDWFGCISKQTYNIVKQVRSKNEPVEPWQLSYVPHGINSDKFFKLTEDHEEWNNYQQFKEKILGGKDYEFVIFYNSRNIRRKMTSDIILATQKFVEELPEEDRDKVCLLMHTQPIDDNGTDLWAVQKAVAPDVNLIFSEQKVDERGMNALYNMSDVLINISSNEGFGLSVAEALMTETPVVVNVTGGLQDQCGFRDEEGNLLDPEKHFNYDWGSNHDGRYKDHGPWVVPVWPKTRSLQGSPVTPYIFDDRADWQDVAVALREWYDRDPEERADAGKKGREFCLEEGGLNIENMANLFMEHMDVALENFTPRERYRLEVV